MTIVPNKYVACAYKLYAGYDGDRTLMEEAPAESPLEYIHGMGMMLPAFEKNLFGLKVGDGFDFDILSADAYGSRVEENVLELPKQVFIGDDGEFDSSIVYEGNTVPMRDSEGNVLHGAVLEVRDEVVVIDFNHPLAGEDLHFQGTVLAVREANEEDNARFFQSNSCGCGCATEKGGCGDGDCGCDCSSGCRS